MTRLGDGLTKKIADLFRKGWSKQSVCAKAGISTSAFDKWWKVGNEMLENNGFSKEDALHNIKNNEFLSKSDRRSLTHQVNFACEVQRAVGEQIGSIEESAYNGALEDPKAAIAWLERRVPKHWAKQLAPPVVVETHPIKQIIIHSGEDEPKQLVESDSIEAEFEDV